MDRNQKIALARIISDLIESDFIIEESEMELFEKLVSREHLKITKSMLVEGKRLTLAKAVKILCELPEGEKAEMISLFKDMALADGTCVPQEAMLIISLIESLDGSSEIYSVETGDLNIDNLTAIYIENENNTLENGYVESNFRVINNELAMAGFYFVYIPHIAHDFETLDNDYLKKVVSYMIPSATDEEVCNFCEDLRTISTARFCRDLLYKKIGIDLTDASPSLLFKINDSAVVSNVGSDGAERVAYSNFLLLRIGDDMLQTIKKIVDTFSRMVSQIIPVQPPLGHKRFIYNGFHRSLFDLICYGKQMKEYLMVIDMERRGMPVVFQSVDGEEEIPIKMGAQEAALYILIVQESLRGEGLDWREHVSKEEKKILMDKYNAIYRKLGKGRVASDYKDRTLAHHIRTKVKALSQMANRSMFVPENVKDRKVSYYRVMAPKSHVIFVDE